MFSNGEIILTTRIIYINEVSGEGKARLDSFKNSRCHPAFLFPVPRHPDVIQKKKCIFENNLPEQSYQGLEIEYIFLLQLSNPGCRLLQTIFSLLAINLTAGNFGCRYSILLSDRIIINHNYFCFNSAALLSVPNKDIVPEMLDIIIDYNNG